jgi:predicted dinucleotide-binding enzyme
MRLDGMHPATTTSAGTADIILLTVKSQDVQGACRTVAALHLDATVVTMQNGVRSLHQSQGDSPSLAAIDAAAKIVARVATPTSSCVF